MIKIFLTLLPFVLALNLSAQLNDITGAQVFEISSNSEIIPTPTSVEHNKYFAVYDVNGVEVVVPNIYCGKNLMTVLKPGMNINSLSAKMSSAFGSNRRVRPIAIEPASDAELELTSHNPGSTIVSLNQFLPENVAALFNRPAGFAGPNCFNAAFTASGLTRIDNLRHVGNPETNQLLSMYFNKVSRNNLRSGDILILNDGDHGVYYLGAGLIFHKKSYLTEHIYRIVLLENAYKPEPKEWHPGPFNGPDPFAGDIPIKKIEPWRSLGMEYQFGPATADEQAKAEVSIFLAGHIEKQCPKWGFAKELGYFTELLLENLVSDWGDMANSSNPVLKAYYEQLKSLRDQANQSIESELLSSTHAQSNANEILKRAWLRRNDYSKELIGKLLKIYGRSPSETDKVLDAIEKDFNHSPLKHITQ
ncbi:MAG: hypothetical protein KKD35_06480 [Elusimicrobia bacterium]|nr:hypothetical protein [Elusimicrobiota bacterium]